MVEMRTDPLDIDGLISNAGAEDWKGFPEGSTIGHIHLQVGALAPAEAFYSAALGFDITSRYPGGTFYSTGGYHHHLATNIWRSRGAGVRAQPATGLADVEIIAGDAEVVDGAAKRLREANIATDPTDGGFSVRDPWGTQLTIRKAG
jgi:catechol 2,3-dioxygenase